MRRIAVVIALAVLTGCSGDDVLGPTDPLASPSPAPSATPTPVPTPRPITFDATYIFRSDNPADESFGVGDIIPLHAEQQCSQVGEDGIRRVAECPYSPGIWIWLSLGRAVCLPVTNLFTADVQFKCSTPGQFDVTVTPPEGPQGRAILIVSP